jgi:hypothetical protein
MKQPSHATQRKQYEIANDVPFFVHLGTRTFKCKYLKGKAQDKISMLHVSQKVIESDDPKEILAAMKHNNRIHAKAVAVMILNSYWKLKFFYPFFWRWLYHTYSSKDFTEAMQIIQEANGTEFFFLNTISLLTSNTLKMKMTKKEAEQLLAELQSEKKPAS